MFRNGIAGHSSVKSTLANNSKNQQKLKNKDELFFESALPLISSKHTFGKSVHGSCFKHFTAGNC